MVATTPTDRQAAIKLYDTDAKTFDGDLKNGVAAIKKDRDQLQSDLKTLAPHLKTDEAADIKAAINNDPTVQTAQAALKDEQETATSTVKLAFTAIQEAPTSAGRDIAIDRYQTDVSTLDAAIKTDQAAVQTAINNDSGVAAVQAQFLKSDASITADQTTPHGRLHPNLPPTSRPSRAAGPAAAAISSSPIPSSASSRVSWIR